MKKLMTTLLAVLLCMSFVFVACTAGGPDGTYTDPATGNKVTFNRGSMKMETAMITGATVTTNGTYEVDGNKITYTIDGVEGTATYEGSTVQIAGIKYTK